VDILLDGCSYYNIHIAGCILTNEIVVLSRLKFESSGLRRERPERYGDVHKFVRLVAVRYDPRIGISDSAHIIFLLGHLETKKRNRFRITYYMLQYNV